MKTIKEKILKCKKVERSWETSFSKFQTFSFLSQKKINRFLYKFKFLNKNKVTAQLEFWKDDELIQS